MNRVILTIIFLLMLTSIAFADNFQIRAPNASGSTVLVANSAVKVFSGNREIFKGTTDRYGRIIINIGTGTYQIEVSFRGKTYKRSITINGRREFKNINFTSNEGR